VTYFKIKPVLHETVQVFKEPPEEGAHRKKDQQISSLVCQHAPSGPAISKRIDHHNIRKPQRGKGMVLKEGKPSKAGPGKEPENYSGAYPSISPPGKGMCGWFLVSATFTIPYSLKNKGKQNNSRYEDHAEEKGEKKGLMRHIESIWRKFHIGCQVPSHVKNTEKGKPH